MHAVMADERMRGFVAHLRLNGYSLGVGATADALQALELFSLQPLGAVKNILRALFAGEHGEWARFDELFDAYWLGRGMRAAQPTAYSPAARRLWSASLPELADSGSGVYEAAGTEEEDGEEEGQDNNATATTRRHGSRRQGGNPAQTPPLSDKEQIQQCGARLASFLARRRSRRTIAAKHGKGVHFRRTIRKNLSAGGEPFMLMRRARKTQTTKLAVLLDVSASMHEHSSFFLFLLKGMLSAAATVEVFIFHTRLVRLSSALNSQYGGMKTLEKFALQTQGVGGGTRIAGCLEDFMRLYGVRVLGGRSTLLVISDGYDSDGSGRLEQTLAALRRRTSRLFWLSPALGGGRLPAALDGAHRHLSALAAARTAADIDILPEQWREI